MRLGEAAQCTVVFPSQSLTRAGLLEHHTGNRSTATVQRVATAGLKHSGCMLCFYSSK